MMRKFYIAVALLSSVWGYVAADSQSELLGRAKSLLEHGRYADARHEYMRLKQAAPYYKLGSEIYIKVREKLLKAVVVKPPFFSK